MASWWSSGKKGGGKNPDATKGGKKSSYKSNDYYQDSSYSRAAHQPQSGGGAGYNPNVYQDQHAPYQPAARTADQYYHSVVPEYNNGKQGKSAYGGGYNNPGSYQGSSSEESSTVNKGHHYGGKKKGGGPYVEPSIYHNSTYGAAGKLSGGGTSKGNKHAKSDAYYAWNEYNADYNRHSNAGRQAVLQDADHRPEHVPFAGPSGAPPGLSPPASMLQAPPLVPDYPGTKGYLSKGKDGNFGGQANIKGAGAEQLTSNGTTAATTAGTTAAGITAKAAPPADNSLCLATIASQQAGGSSVYKYKRESPNGMHVLTHMPLVSDEYRMKLLLKKTRLDADDFPLEERKETSPEGRQQQKRSRCREAAAAKYYDFVKMSTQDLVFCLGRGGHTKMKIADAAGCNVEIDQDRGIGECYSNTDFAACRRGIQCLQFCGAQRRDETPVVRYPEDFSADVTIIHVPEETSGFVMGRQGSFLRQLEEMYMVYIFFCEPEGRGISRERGMRYVCILGANEMGRKGAALKVMGAVETKLPGYYLDDCDIHYCPASRGGPHGGTGFDTEARTMSNDEMSFAVGKEGQTRKKLARASAGAAFEFVGLTAFMAGPENARKRLRNYLEILLRQRSYSTVGLTFPDKNTRPDCTVLKIPSTYMGLLKGQALRDLENQTDTFCLVEGDPDLSTVLIILGGENERHNAQVRVQEIVRLPENVLLGKESLNTGKTRGGGSGRLIMVEVPIPTLLLVENVEELLPKLRDQLGKLRISEAKIQEDALRIKVSQENAAQCAMICENFLNKDIDCEVPYYIPRGIGFAVLTSKQREAWKFVMDQGSGKLVKQTFRDPKNPLNYLDEETSRIFDYPIAGERGDRGEVIPASFIPCGAIPVNSILEDVRSRSRLRVRIFKDQRRVLFSGSLSQVVAAKRDLDLCLGSFLTLVILVNQECVFDEKMVSHCVGKIQADMQYRHHMIAANIKDFRLTLSGSNLAVWEAKELVEKELQHTVLVAKQQKKNKEKTPKNHTGAAASSADTAASSSKSTTNPAEIGSLTLTEGNLKKLADKPKKKNWADYEDDLSNEQNQWENRNKNKPPPVVFVSVDQYYLLPHLRQGVLAKERNEPTSEWLRVPEDDSSFVMGKGGRTRLKISVVSGCRIEIKRDQEDGLEVIELTGTALERRRARKYLDMIRIQRKGAVHVDEEAHNDKDLTAISVPHDCVGFVTGGGGSHLRNCETEFHTLMFFCDYHHQRGKGIRQQTEERLVIFGQRRGQLGSKLKVMSAIETKMPGYFTRNRRADYLRGREIASVPVEEGRGRKNVIHGEDWKREDFTPILCGAEWGIDTMWVEQNDLSFAMGSNGVTRKKLCKATNCILEFVGNIAHLGGTKRERRTCRDYLNWLLCQRTGVVALEDLDGSVYSAKQVFAETKRRERRRRRLKEEVLAERAAAKKRMRSKHNKDGGNQQELTVEEINAAEEREIKQSPMSASPDVDRLEKQAASSPDAVNQDPDQNHHNSDHSDNSNMGDFSAEEEDAVILAVSQHRKNPDLKTKHRRRDQKRFTHNISREEYHEFVYDWMADRDDVDVLFFYEKCDIFSVQALRQVEENTGTYTFVDNLSKPNCLFVCGAYRQNRQKAMDAIYEILREYDELDRTSWADETPEAGKACRIKGPVGPNKRHLSTSEKDLLIQSGGANVEVGAAYQELSMTHTRFEDRDLAFYTMLANRRDNVAFYNNEFREEKLVYNKSKDFREEDEHSDGGRFDSVELWQSPLPDMQIYQQPGPLGEDPLIEGLESSRLRVSLLVAKHAIRLEGEPKELRDAWRKLNTFAAKFETLQLEVRQQNADQNLLRSVLSHYVGPLPWLSKAEIKDGDKVTLVGHSVSLNKALKILEEYLGDKSFVYKTKAVANPNSASLALKTGGALAADRSASAAAHKSGGERSQARRQEQASIADKHASLDPSAVVGVRDFRTNNDLTDKIKMASEEIGFVLGTSGTTRDKLGIAAKALLHGDVMDSDTVTVEGSNFAREFAKKYIGMVRQQRVGPVPVNRDDEDLMLVEIPYDCIGLVTGVHGAHLRKLERACQTLMFFADYFRKDSEKNSKETGIASDTEGKPQKLAIFSPDPRARAWALLRVFGLSDFPREQVVISDLEKLISTAFERHNERVRGEVLQNLDGSGQGENQAAARVERDEVIGVESLPMSKKYHAATDGHVLRRTARSSGCIVEQIGNRAIVLVGSESERKRAKAYLEWNSDEKQLPQALEASKRKDCIVLRSGKKLSTSYAKTYGSGFDSLETNQLESCIVFPLLEGDINAKTAEPQSGATTASDLHKVADGSVEILDGTLSSSSSDNPHPVSAEQKSQQCHYQVGIFACSMRARVLMMLRLLKQDHEKEKSSAFLDLCKQELNRSRRHLRHAVAARKASADANSIDAATNSNPPSPPSVHSRQSSKESKQEMKKSTWLYQYHSFADYTESAIQKEVKDLEDFEFEELKFTKNEKYYTGSLSKHRSKLVEASGAFLEFCGNGCILGGSKDNRQRCKDYMAWLLRKCFEKSGWDEYDLDAEENCSAWRAVIPHLENVSLNLRTDVLCFRNPGAAITTEQIRDAEINFGVFTYFRRTNDDKDRELLIFAAQYEKRLHAYRQLLACLLGGRDRNRKRFRRRRRDRERRRRWWDEDDGKWDDEDGNYYDDEDAGNAANYDEEDDYEKPKKTTSTRSGKKKQVDDDLDYARSPRKRGVTPPPRGAANKAASQRSSPSKAGKSSRAETPANASRASRRRRAPLQSEENNRNEFQALSPAKSGSRRAGMQSNRDADYVSESSSELDEDYTPRGRGRGARRNSVRSKGTGKANARGEATPAGSSASRQRGGAGTAGALGGTSPRDNKGRGKQATLGGGGLLSSDSEDDYSSDDDEDDDGTHSEYSSASGSQEPRGYPGSENSGSWNGHSRYT
ncbi:unnamed protein product [Amoebophrya sp. A120]|nr:unnamed protein product [Amoebophrya sp. A120]|eukprot:GSA120T00005411001.1